MQNPSFPRSLLALAVGVGFPLLAPSDASACSYARPREVTLLGEEIPADGVIAGRVHGCAQCSLTELRVFEGASGKSIAGRLEPRESQLGSGWFVFRPTEPLTVGARYTVRAVRPMEPGSSERELTEGQTFEAVAPDSTAPELLASGSIGSRDVTSVRCRSYDGEAVAGSCSTPTFSDKRAYLPQWVVELRGSAATQFAYRVIWSADGAVVEQQRLEEPFAVRLFDGSPASVCYELFALSLVDGTEQRLRAECHTVDRSQIGERAELHGEIAWTLRSCIEPPEGYEREWCDEFVAERRRGACHDKARAACASALERCPPAGNGQEEEQVRSAAGNDESREHPSTPSDEEAGCAVRADFGASGGALPWLGLVWLAVRRRRLR